MARNDALRKDKEIEGILKWMDTQDLSTEVRVQIGQIRGIQYAARNAVLDEIDAAIYSEPWWPASGKESAKRVLDIIKDMREA